MTGERPDVLQRLDSAADAISSLTDLRTAEGSVDEVLLQVARSAVRAVPDADAVSITVLGDPQPRTAASTNDEVLALDGEQYASQRGPCIEAAQTRQPVRVAMATHEQRWPEFVAAARASGVQATLSIPLIIPSPAPGGGDELVGSLNAYSHSASEFDVIDEKLMCLYTGAATQAIADTSRWLRLRDNVVQLEQALLSRADIDQAKGAIRAMNGSSADEAFASMVTQSQRTNVKLRDLARQLLDALPRRVSTE
jgi:GAF domain-containing protein